MAYYFSKTIPSDSLDEAVNKVADVLKTQGFGILAEIDFQKVLKAKLDVDYRPYKVLFACNPPAALKALNADQYMGTLLPCNVIVQQAKSGFDVGIIDPVAAVKEVPSEVVQELSTEIKAKLQQALTDL
ncbi:MAG: DUF302 domain-containing protein [Bacteroidales bacterium]|nr:DUF302 domain-containing protein [Bacteroidales bacterium]